MMKSTVTWVATELEQLLKITEFKYIYMYMFNLHRTANRPAVRKTLQNPTIFQIRLQH